MDYLGTSQSALEAAGGLWTAREISQQPAIWSVVQQLVVTASGMSASSKFLNPLLRRRDLRIVLTGAGTSAFIGECIAPTLARQLALRVDAVASTDLVGSPESWLSRELPTLLVSFARSGNSPESVAAIRLAEQCVQECHHLIVTCNADGDLCRWGKAMRNAHVIVLPDQTNDRGFAMTSSFSSMLLATALVFGLMESDAKAMAQYVRWTEQVIVGALPLIESLAHARFDRIVYLGSNALKGLAREAALKTLELSDGQVVAMSDTPLGFRHGPKTIVNAKTLVVVLLCNDAYTRQYDLDLLEELRADGVAGRVLALTAQPMPVPDHADDVLLADAVQASDLALCLPYAAFAQSLAFLQSLSLGLRPDVPNASGTVSRVVKGVAIHSLAGGSR